MNGKVKRDLDRLMFDLNGQALQAVDYIRNFETYQGNNPNYPNLTPKEYMETCCIVIEDEIQSLYRNR
jgi:hypothetical protein